MRSLLTFLRFTFLNFNAAVQRTISQLTPANPERKRRMAIATAFSSTSRSLRLAIALAIVCSLSFAAWHVSASETNGNWLVRLKSAPASVLAAVFQANTRTVKKSGAASPLAGYQETFSTPNKGYLVSCVNDFTGVNWSLSPWNPTGTCQIADLRDPTDYFNTTVAGQLESVDLDQPVYWESPLLSISNPGTVSLSVDLSWVGFDTDIAANNLSGDYIKVQYSVNGGAYTTVPSVAGTNHPLATVGYVFNTPGFPFTSSATSNVSGITGSTLKIRVEVFTNANAEVVTIDNVSVPEAGVFIITGPTVISPTSTGITATSATLGGTPRSSNRARRTWPVSLLPVRRWVVLSHLIMERRSPSEVWFTHSLR